MTDRKFAGSLADLRPGLLLAACVCASLVAYYHFYGDFGFAIAGLPIKVAGYSNPVIILILLLLAFTATGKKTDYPALAPCDKREISFAALICAAIAFAPITYNGFEAIRFASLLLLILAAGLSFSKKPLQSEDSFTAFITRHQTVVMGTLFLLFLALLTFHFGLREYYYDSADQIQLGNHIRAINFMATHARLSGGGVHNPPMSGYMMGALTAISQAPSTLNAITSAFNAIAVLAAIVYFSKALPPLFAFISALLLAISPFTLIYSNVMWEGSLVFPCAIIFHMKMKGFIANNDQKALVIATAAAVFSSQNHQSGFFYFPALIAIFLLYSKSIRVKTFAVAGIASAIILAPYMGYMFFGGGLASIIKYVSTPDQVFGYIMYYSDAPDALEFKGQMPLYNIGAASTYFFQFIFARHFGSAIEYRGIGIERVIYLVSLMSACMFIIGWARYILWAVAGKRFFSAEPEDTQRFPIPFQIAGFMVTTVTVAFLMAAKALWLKHYLILFPSYAILTAWPVWRLWRFSGVRATFTASAASSLAATLLLLLTIKSLGCGMYGAIHFYGLTYEKISEIAEKVKLALKPGESPQLLVSGTWGSPLTTVVFKDAYSPNASAVPVSIHVRQMSEDRFFPAQLVVERLAEKMEAHGRILREALALIPVSATISASDTLNGGAFAVITSFPAPPPFADTPWMLVKERPGAKKWSENGDQPDGEYLILDTSDPRLPGEYPAHHVHPLLIGDLYNVVYYKGGVLVFKRNAPRIMDDKMLLGDFNTFDASEMGSTTGEIKFYGTTLRKQFREAREGLSKEGFLAFGFYMDLPTADYSAIFRVMADRRRAGDTPMILDVTCNRGQTLLARREVKAGQTGQWQEVKLDFTIKEPLAKDVEFHAYFTGAGYAAFEHVRLFKTPPPI